MSQYTAHDKSSLVLAGGLILPGGDAPDPKTPAEQEKYDELVKAGLLVLNAKETKVVPPKAPVVETPDNTDTEDAPLRRGTSGIWNYNPELIKRYGIKRLNALAVEVDPTIELFDDAAEAKAFLSQDFE